MITPSIPQLTGEDFSSSTSEGVSPYRVGKSSHERMNQPTTSPKACYSQGSGHFSPRGKEVLSDNRINKGTAFTNLERTRLGLHGFLPASVESIDQQIERCEEAMVNIKMVDEKQGSLFKYQYLTNLRNNNETLFYALLQKNVKKYMPFVYTPTVGLACQQFSHIFNHDSEGIFLSVDSTEAEMEAIMTSYAEAAKSQVSIIVVTDGSRILGLGDLGVNGMGIPIGKLALYVAVGGFHPISILPVTIDFGTGNKTILEDPLYLGRKAQRPADDVFYRVTDSFMKVSTKIFPNCVIQFEDFENKHCFELLDRNRTAYRCFNDDIQGTGVVAAAGILSGIKFLEEEDGIKPQDNRFLFYGFGSASAGVAHQIVSCLHEKHPSLSMKTLQNMFYMVDSKGLCTTGRGDTLPEYKLPFTRTEADAPHGKGLSEVIDIIKPTVLIGLSGQGQTFTEEIVKKMATHNAHPVVFALSNPTSQAECTFSQAMEWTAGKVVWAAGSPFDDVGGRISPQGNNLYAFPGIGFGAWLCQATLISDGMMNAATRAISDAVNPNELMNLYPALCSVAAVSDRVAAEVIKAAKAEGLAQSATPDDPEKLLEFVKMNRYAPVYGSSY